MNNLVVFWAQTYPRSDPPGGAVDLPEVRATLGF
jgi:hypothetical protein